MFVDCLFQLFSEFRKPRVAGGLDYLSRNVLPSSRGSNWIGGHAGAFITRRRAKLSNTDHCDCSVRVIVCSALSKSVQNRTAKISRALR
jgi:hypothetical protein